MLVGTPQPAGRTGAIAGLERTRQIGECTGGYVGNVKKMTGTWGGHPGAGSGGRRCFVGQEADPPPQEAWQGGEQ